MSDVQKRIQQQAPQLREKLVEIKNAIHKLERKCCIPTAEELGYLLMSCRHDLLTLAEFALDCAEERNL